MKTLLTGFGPFGKVVDNPSARIVRHFEAVGAEGHALTTRVFPVSFARAAEEVRRLLTEGGFDAAVLLGVAGKEPELRLERLGRNLNRARIPDCDGHQPLDVPIVEGGPETSAATVDLPALLGVLRMAGFPARISEDAGAYVCNRTYYAALHALAEGGYATRCLFLHVPADQQTFDPTVDEPWGEAYLPIERQIAAVEATLAWLAATDTAARAET